VSLKFWRERGAIACAEGSFTVWRQSGWGAYVLDQGGAVIASAEKEGTFSRTFLIPSTAGPLTLKPRGIWQRAMVLHDGDAEIGWISPAGIWSRSARIDLPEQLPVAMRLFLLWLTLILWRRAASSAAASST
jgi:hypothetical protein